MSAVQRAHYVGETAPLIDQTIGDYLEGIASQQAEREALVMPHQGIRWSYAEFNRQVDRFAAGLIHLGIEKGDRVGIYALRPVHKEGSFEFAFWDILMAHHKILLENGRPTNRLMRAWKTAQREDEAEALTQWVENGDQAWGFEHLISQGLLDMTAEKLVLRFPKRFDAEVCDQARQRIKQMNNHSIEAA